MVERSKILEEKRRRWKKGLMLIHSSQEEIFDEIMDLLEATANDAAYYRSILNGDHPYSRELLKNAIVNLINKTKS